MIGRGGFGGKRSATIIFLTLFFLTNMWEVFQVPIQRRYTAPCCSCAVCLRLLSIVVLIVVPFFLAFTSHSFWLKESLHYEQPKVIFKHQVLVLARTHSVENEAGDGILFSTIDAGRFSSEARLRPSSTRVCFVLSRGLGQTLSLERPALLPRPSCVCPLAIS